MPTPCALDGSAKALLLQRAELGQPGQCWEWPGAKTQNGYGRIGVGKTLRYVHRLSYAAFVGPIADGLFVCHRCDNPGCWNPDHLFVGTARANNADRAAKGRGYQGVRHHAAKLTEDDVRAIRASGLTGPKLAAIYGVKFSAIYKILDGRSWKHVK